MRFAFTLVFLVSIIASEGFSGKTSGDYSIYHQQILKAETALAEERFRDALNYYEQVFDQFEFVFVRDYKVAAQLALYLDDRTKAFDYIKKGLKGGWDPKDIRKNRYLKALQGDPEWKTLEQSYEELRRTFKNRIDTDLRSQVQQMFQKDQKKALGALFRLGNKAQEKYYTNTFAPHSEKQLLELMDIMDKKGYPGEKLIGNDFWMSTIVSHHNSISREHALKDTLYPAIRPRLYNAIEKGEISPYEYALMEDWLLAVRSERTEPGYGYLTLPKKETLSKTDQLRAKIGLRSIGLRNRLVQVARKTGMDFYLPDWIEGEIAVE